MKIYKLPKIKIRDRERTMARILKATGKIIQQDGLEGLTPGKIAKTGEISPILIYRYFGTMDNLRTQYLASIESSGDTPSCFIEKAGKDLDLNTAAHLKELMLALWDEFQQDSAKQKMLRWEFASGCMIQSDDYNAAILRLLDASGRTPVGEDLKVLVTFLVAAIYFLCASADCKENVFGIDLKSAHGMLRIENVIKRIIDGKEK